MANELVDLTVQEVSGVDFAANKRRFLVIKRADPAKPADPAPTTKRAQLFASLKALLKLATPEQLEKAGIEVTAVDTSTDFNAELLERKIYDIRSGLYDYTAALMDALCAHLTNGDSPETIDASLSQFATAIKGEIAQWTPAAMEKAGKKISADRLSRMKAMHKTLADMITEQDPEYATPKTEPAKKGAAMAEPTNTPTVADVLKAAHGLTAEQRTALEKRAEAKPALAAILKGTDQGLRDYAIASELEKIDAEDRLAKSEQATAAEIEKREISDFTKRAETEFSHLAGTPLEKATILRKLSKGLPLTADEWKAHETALKAASEQLKSGAIVRPQGLPAATQKGSAYAEIQAAAAELRKADPKLTEAAAIVKAADANPELKQRYADERAAAH